MDVKSPKSVLVRGSEFIRLFSKGDGVAVDTCVQVTGTAKITLLVSEGSVEVGQD